jgi:uncharacterized coiled-coil protein SlyX
MSNRVEELEAKVSELQAAVDGLTEELVETRERLRQLESEQGADVERTPVRRRQADPEPAESGADVEEANSPESEERADEETSESESEDSDIIVA